MKRLLLIAALLWPVTALAQPVPPWSTNVRLPAFVIPPSAVSGGGTFPAQLFGPTGTCAAPAYAFTGATTTGMAGTTTPSVLECVGGTTVATWAVPSGAATTSNLLNSTATVTPVSAAVRGWNLQITGAGSAAFGIQALNVDLLAGYTGAGSTLSGRFSNASAGTATTGWTGGGNIANNGNATGTTAGHNLGASFSASGSSALNVGALARVASSSSTLNIGVGGLSLNGTSSVGGFFGLMSTAPTIATSAALMADNGAVAADIFTARDNGTAVTSIPDGGGFAMTALALSPTAPTIASGFGTTPSIPNANGTAAFTVNVGTGGVASSGVLTFPTAATGWVVDCTNITNAATSVTAQTAGTTTSVTLANYSRTTGLLTAWVASDVLRCKAMAY